MRNPDHFPGWLFGITPNGQNRKLKMLSFSKNAVTLPVAASSSWAEAYALLMGFVASQFLLPYYASFCTPCMMLLGEH